MWWLRTPLRSPGFDSCGVLAMLFFFFYSPTDGAAQGKESACLEDFLAASACQVYSSSSVVTVSESFSQLGPLRSYEKEAAIFKRRLPQSKFLRLLSFHRISCIICDE